MSDLMEILAEIEAKYCTMKVTSASLELGEWHDAFTKEILTAVADAVERITANDTDKWIQESAFKGLYPDHVLAAGACIAIGGIVKMLRTQAEGKEE